MDEPVIATGLKGVLLAEEPWLTAHERWFEERANELQDPDVLDWIGADDYFEGVDEVMRRLHPDLTGEERTVRARETFSDTVVAGVDEHARNEDAIAYFKHLKERFTLALATTNTQDATQRILDAANLTGFFDAIVASRAAEKDDKAAVLDRLADEHGPPVVYVGSERPEAQQWCERHGVTLVEAGEDVVSRVRKALG